MASGLGLVVSLVGEPVWASQGRTRAELGVRAGAADQRSSTGDERKGSGFRWPELVYGGNALSLGLPLQVAVSSTYEPRVRLGLNYERQAHRGHWVGGGAALLLDRGNWQTFRMDNCGKVAQGPVCDRGPVAGFDIAAHYSYRFYLSKAPWLVPSLKAGIGGGAWRYPKKNGISLQQRTGSWTMSLRPGAGFRVFPLVNLGIGAEVSGQLGFVRHRVGTSPDSSNGSTGSTRATAPAAGASSDFLFGFEILPLVVEGRF